MTSSTIQFGDNEGSLATSVFPFPELIASCIYEIETRECLTVRPPITMYGKVCCQPRSVGFFSKGISSFDYSRGNHLPAINIQDNSVMDQLLETVNRLRPSHKQQFNGILVNRYDGGNDYVAAHSDKQHIEQNEDVWSVSWGETRLFRIRDKKTKNIVFDLPLTQGVLCEMNGNFQSRYTHEIVKEPKKKGIRYSFTFRKHL